MDNSPVTDANGNAQASDDTQGVFSEVPLQQIVAQEVSAARPSAGASSTGLPVAVTKGVERGVWWLGSAAVLRTVAMRPTGKTRSTR